MKPKKKQMEVIDGAGYEIQSEMLAEAARQFVRLWCSGNFDCGPQDFEGMAEQTMEAFERLRSAENSNESLL